MNRPTVEAYTPIAVQFLPEPLITWADLRGVRFDAPFFRDTLSGVSSDRLTALTGIDELRALDDRPTVAPGLLVFQVSRCGSTLLSQMLAAVSTNVVLSEASVINEVLLSPLAWAEKSELLRLVIRALARNRHGEVQRLIVKFSSWNVLFAQMIHLAFPETPMIWLQRDPIHVAASHAHQPAGWMAWRDSDSPGLSMLGLTGAQARAMSPRGFRLHVIEALFRAAEGARLPWQVIDYSELPAALWEKIVPQARLAMDPGDVEQMRARSRFASKDSGQIRFVARDRTSALSHEERQVIAERITPLYRRIALGIGP